MKKLKNILNALVNKKVKEEEVNVFEIKDFTKETIDLNMLLNNNLMF